VGDLSLVARMLFESDQFEIFSCYSHDKAIQQLLQNHPKA